MADGNVITKEIFNRCIDVKLRNVSFLGYERIYGKFEVKDTPECIRECDKFLDIMKTMMDIAKIEQAKSKV